MADQAAAVGPRPEAAVRRFVEREDEGIGDGWRVGAIEDSEAEAIESNKAFVRAEPEISVAGLGDGVDGILGQALVGGPRLVHVPVEGLRWIERQHRARPGGAPQPDGQRQNRRSDVGDCEHSDVPASLPRFARSVADSKRAPARGTITAMGTSEPGDERLHRWVATTSPRLRAHRRRLQHRVGHPRLPQRPGRMETAAARDDPGVPRGGGRLSAVLGAGLRRLAALLHRVAGRRASRLRGLGGRRHAASSRHPERRRPAPARRQPGGASISMAASTTWSAWTAADARPARPFRRS